MRISCFFLLQPLKNTINCGLPSHALNIKNASETAFTTCCCPTADSPLLQHISKDQSTFPSQSGKGLSLESQSNGSELLQFFWFQRFQLASYYHISLLVEQLQTLHFELVHILGRNFIPDAT